MIKLIAGNITSPLGNTTDSNWKAVMEGRSAVGRHPSFAGLPINVTASAFSEEQNMEMAVEGHGRFESMVIRSVREALSHCNMDVSSPRTVFILSTSLDNVELLAARKEDDRGYLSPGESAERIASFLGFTTRPIVSCNACVSGLAAQILADRLVNLGFFDNAVICGADCVSPFLASGFSCLKVLSDEVCRPFDIERLGMNLGEAAATMVYTRCEDASEECWKFISGHLNNDAYHISAPDPGGEGVVNAIKKTLGNNDMARLAMICAHGSATMFNDQMESKAIEKAGLSGVPVTALKAYFGHTIGASGILESLIVMKSLDKGHLLPMKGFEEMGVSGKINVCTAVEPTDKRSFLKIISGFGGGNGAVLFSKEALEGGEYSKTAKENVKVLHNARISPDSIEVDGKKLELCSKGKEILTEAYKKYIGDWPKYYRMDPLGRLVNVAAALVCPLEAKTEGNDMAVLIFNRSASVLADRQHLASIYAPDGYYPGPAAFSYSIPNIATSETAIRFGAKGENSLTVLGSKDSAVMDMVTLATFQQKGTSSMICGWADYSEENIFEAEVKLLQIKELNGRT